jgi:hypothetical protein
MKIHVRKDGSEFEIRLSAGVQIWDVGCVSQHMGAVKHEVEKRGGWIETRPKSRTRKKKWTESDLAELKYLLEKREAREP